jgi:flavin reductase (DIM6/NTAB) family NADH-FMN oxidoreductase RutF
VTNALTPHATQLRRAAGQFTTGVTIVTCLDTQRQPQGMTANSFASVSLDPPMVLWSVGKGARSCEHFRNSAYFAIHVLTEQQAALSNQFAKAGIDKFANVNYSANAHGIPVLQNCLAVFECSQFACHDAGDHWIIVGHVLQMHEHPHPHTPPLVFQRGRYCGLMHALDPHQTLDLGKAWMGMEPESWS